MEGSEGSRRSVVIAAAVVAVVALVAVVIWLLARDDEDDAGPATTTTVATAPATSTPETTRTTTAPPTTAPATTAPATTAPATTAPATTAPATTVGPPPFDDRILALWPAWDVADVYTDPVAVATDFAEQMIGMTDPEIGPFLQGDSRSGEVEVTAPPATLATTVFVRQLGPDDGWFVIGAANADIVVDQPQTLALVTSPLTLSGEARAFEGTVEVALWADGGTVPIATTFVTGSGGPDLGPFTGTLTFTSPGSGGGALIFTSTSPEDGSVLEFAALRVLFGPEG